MPSTIISTGHLEMGKTKEALALKELTFQRGITRKRRKEGRKARREKGREGGREGGDIRY